MSKSAIVGCGTVGPHHAEAYRETQHIQLAAVVDIDPKKAEKLGKEFDVPWYIDVKKVLRRKDIDFIDVCVPSGQHGDIAIRAARAGKHCICEKPLDVTPQRCDRMIAAFAKSGTTLGGIFQHRFAYNVQRTKEAIDAGHFGRITLATCSTPWWRTQEYYDSGDWRGTWKFDGGGALMNQSIHAIDLLVWLIGPIKTVTARTALLAHKRIEVEDAAVAVCEFESGALGIIQGTTAAYPGSGVRHEIMGTDGMAYLTNDKIDLWKLRDEEEGAVKPAAAAPASNGAAGDPKASGAASNPPAPSDNTSTLIIGDTTTTCCVSGNMFVKNIDDIAYAALTGTTPCVSGSAAKKAVEVICAIYKSAQTGKTVTLPLRRFVPPKDRRATIGGHTPAESPFHFQSSALWAGRTSASRAF
jgi:UDP-N-acetyl-2-amino-2-deoxyglucuronate dehydrogenase